MIYEQDAVQLNCLSTTEDNKDMVFSLSGFRRGTAQGLANYLRILLYQSIPGYAPISYKLVGIEHYLDATSNFSEDAREITLNIADIRAYRKDMKESFILKTNRIVDGPVTAGDLMATDLNGNPLDVEIINKDLVLFNTVGQQKIDLSVLFKMEIGSIGSEDHIINIQEPMKSILDSSIRLDADFSPVELVHYDIVEDSPLVGRDTIILRIRTNGTVPANGALTLAGAMVARQMMPLQKLYNMNWTKMKVEVTDDKDLMELYEKYKNPTQRHGEGVQVGIGQTLSGENSMQVPGTVEDGAEVSGTASETGLAWTEDDKPDEDMTVEELNLKPKSYNWLKGNNIQCIRDLRKYDEVTGKDSYPEDIRDELILALDGIGFKEIIKR